MVLWEERYKQLETEMLMSICAAETSEIYTNETTTQPAHPAKTAWCAPGRLPPSPLDVESTFHRRCNTHPFFSPAVAPRCDVNGTRVHLDRFCTVLRRGGGRLNAKSPYSFRRAPFIFSLVYSFIIVFFSASYQYSSRVRHYHHYRSSSTRAL